MNLARKTSYERELVPMPVMTKDDIKFIVDKLKVFNPPIKHKITAFSSKGKVVMDIDDKTETFFQSVRRYGFFSFDTEASGKLKFNRGPNAGEEGRSVLVLGNADGEAIIFYDPNNVTAKIRAIFADPTILKVQTGIQADIVLLPFRVFGLVDSGCFVPFFDSSIRNFSLTHLHEFVYPNGPFRVEWPFRTAMREYKNETLHMIKDRTPRLNEALVHSLQDVFTPIAAAFQIGSTTLFADYDRFPFINDLLELCWAKCPSGMALSKLSCKELWV